MQLCSTLQGPVMAWSVLKPTTENTRKVAPANSAGDVPKFGLPWTISLSTASRSAVAAKQLRTNMQPDPHGWKNRIRDRL